MPVKGRSRAFGVQRGARHITVVDDSYNANPDSMHAAIAVLAELPAPRLLVMGDMGEVGDQGPQFHTEAGAHARAMLINAAAVQWKVQAAECKASAGVVEHAAGQRATFGELVALAAQQPPPGKVTLKGPAEFKLIGKPLTRIEAPSKLDGTAVFGIDAHPPGLLHASVVMCPTRGGKVAQFDGAAAQKMPGVKQVLAVAPYHGGTGGVAVIADTPWHAKKAAAAVTVQWDHGPAAMLSSAAVMTQLTLSLYQAHVSASPSVRAVLPDMQSAATSLSLISIARRRL